MATNENHGLTQEDISNLEVAIRGALELNAREARKGDVTNFIAFQWPGLILDDFQWDVINHVFDPAHREVFIKGCTKPGKGFSVAVAVNIWFDVFPKSKIILTGPSAEHVTNNLFAEVVAVRKRMKYPAVAEILTTSIRSGMNNEDPTHYIRIANPKSGEGFSGQHSTHTLFVFDEACHDAKTEVLTRRGWQLFKNLTSVDEVLTMDPATQKAFYVKPKKLFATWRKGEMYRVKGKGMDMLLTPSHRMLIYDTETQNYRFECISDVKGGSRWRIPRTFVWDAPDKEEFVIPEFVGPRKTWPERRIPMDAWLRFLGWYLSEGHVGRVNGVPYSVAISQLDGENCREIEAAVDGIRIPHKTRFHENEFGNPSATVFAHSRQLAELMTTYGRRSLTKQIPAYVGECSARQIKIFLDAYLKGDGTRRKSADVFYTSSPAMADELQILAMKCGHRASVTVRNVVGVTKKIGNHTTVATCNSLSVRVMRPTRFQLLPEHIEKVDYNGMVYCASVDPHRVLLTRRNGYVAWSGNSSSEDWMYDNARKQSRMIIALSNPRTLSGWFRRGYGDIDINKTQSIKTASGRRRLITVGGEDCRNVREKRLESPFAPTGGIEIKGTRFEHGDFIPPEFYVHVKPVIASQLDYARYLEIMSDPEEFKRDIFGRGWFPKEDAMLQVVLGSWLKRHIDYWKDLHDGMDIPVTSFGLDVAASEFGDESILISGGPLGVRMIHDRKHADVMQTTGWVLDTATEQYGINLKEGQVPVAIDYGGGYGRGVGDRLKEMGVAVIACHPSKRSSLPSRYEDLRSELYGEFGERLNPHGPWASHPFALPPDQKLHDDLCAAEKIIASDGVKFRLIPKEKPHKLYTGPTVESKIGRSPDRGDAICLLYHAVRRQASIPDYSERSLVIDLSTPEKPPENETPQEKWDRWKREDMARVEETIDSMADGDYEFGF